MSTKDKTRQKLVGSMRKTKSVAGIGSDDTTTEAPTAVAEAPRSVKPAAGGAGKTSKSATAGADGYQSGRRVWPD